MRDLDELRGFDRIIGQDDIIHHLENSINTGKISHAYIFGGEDGSGKNMLASLFAMGLLCRNRTEKGEPCMVCTSCKKALGGNHPDILYVTHSKPASIGVDDVRSQLIDTIDIRPYESDYKIYIIDEAEKLTPSAQNAILKTIEEPPEYAVILLLADNPDILLPTILSRCVVLNLKPVDDNDVRDYLIQNMHVPDYQAEIEASYAQGNIGRAIRAAESPEFIQIVQNAVRLMKSSQNMDTAEMIEAMKFMSADKQNIYAYLDIFSMWFRDVLMFKATREVDNLIFKDEINYVRQRASTSSYEGLETIQKAIETARQRLRANVNFDLVMELLFLTIREN
jgi:DNA polymerase-3 subunit delta'